MCGSRSDGHGLDTYRVCVAHDQTVTVSTRLGCVSHDHSDTTRRSRCNRLRCPLARLSGLQCFNMGHEGHGINLYGVVLARRTRQPRTVEPITPFTSCDACLSLELTRGASLCYQNTVMVCKLSSKHGNGVRAVIKTR